MTAAIAGLSHVDVFCNTVCQHLASVGTCSSHLATILAQFLIVVRIPGSANNNADRHKHLASIRIWSSHLVAILAQFLIMFRIPGRASNNATS